MTSWIAKRSAAFDSSGIRKVFDLAASMTDPINLSIGQPDFEVPEAIQDAAIQAVRSGKNGYSVTQGIAPLREALQRQVDDLYGHSDRRAAVTSGTSGALVLAMLAMVDPGDEVIVFDPYFVMYPALVEMVGGVAVLVDTYPDFRIDVDQVAKVITPRTKMILLNSPANPTGAIAGADEVERLAQLAVQHNIALVSDEIYRHFCYGQTFVSPAKWNDRTIVIDGFSKTYAMTGWRVGFVHGPAEVIDQIVKLQQYTFVCAPQPAQWGGLAALDVNMDEAVATYQRRRDLLVAGLSDCYDLGPSGGAFYLFPRAPWGTGSEFVARAIEQNVLIIPGNIFSRQDTHFRLSYAVDETVLERGIDALRKLAAQTAD